MSEPSLRQILDVAMVAAYEAGRGSSREPQFLEGN
jgi:hypothetical protein